VSSHCQGTSLLPRNRLQRKQQLFPLLHACPLPRQHVYGYASRQWVIFLCWPLRPIACMSQYTDFCPMFMCTEHQLLWGWISVHNWLKQPDLYSVHHLSLSTPFWCSALPRNHAPDHDFVRVFDSLFHTVREQFFSRCDTALYNACYFLRSALEQRNLMTDVFTNFVSSHRTQPIRILTFACLPVPIAGPGSWYMVCCKH
jgi:hypothetical protein